MSIVVNQNVKIRFGGRKAPKVSIQEFKKELAKLLNVDPKKIDYSIENCIIYGIVESLSENSEKYNQFWKDLKIQVDFENVDRPGKFTTESIDIDYVDGDFICQTSTGIPYIPIALGGDWELPMIIFLYWDGKTFRCYVPTGGNCFNRDTKTAFGNDENADKKFLVKEGISVKDMDDLTYDYPMCLEDFESRLEAV